MLPRPVIYFTNKKKLICCGLFVILTLGLFQYLFSLQNSNGKFDFCLEDVIYTTTTTSKILNDTITCSILEAQNQDICQEIWINSDQFVSDDQVQKRLSNCSSYFSAVNTTALLPILELETSLAFSIVVHNQIGLFESLMASIFRPQNSYCIFIDAKASSKFKTLVKALISCYTHQFPKVNLNMFFDQWIN